MNRVAKAAISNLHSHCLYQRAALFHSTPVMDQKRRSYWKPGQGKRTRRMRGKQDLLRNFNAFADYLFQSWKDEFSEDDPSSSRGPSWFRRQYNSGVGRDRPGSQGRRRRGRRAFDFCEDDEVSDIESFLRSTFGGNNYFYWSFINEEEPRQRSYSRYSNDYRRSYWRYRVEEDYDSEEESDPLADSDMTADRLALGLSASGPITLEDVKNAYRTCALKWHPDRHQGSSKVVAEEKFKLCSSAYQSLCDKLAVN